MAKQGGLGAALYVGGYDLSGDTQSYDISSPTNMLDSTDITQSANSRLGGLRDGKLSWVSYFDPGLLASHVALSPLPTADVGLMCVQPVVAIGAPAACMVSKQPNYDPTRGQDGAFTFKVDAIANAFGLEWAQMLTAGVRTDTGATNGTALDTAASVSFGWQAYLQVFAVTAVDCTIKLQDSADNSTFADLTGGAFTAVATAGARQTQRLQGGATATIRRYVRAVTTTSGGMTSVAFAVALVKNTVASATF